MCAVGKISCCVRVKIDLRPEASSVPVSTKKFTTDNINIINRFNFIIQMNIKGRPIHAICIESNIEFFVEPGPKNSQVNCNFIVLAATVSTWRTIVTACTIKICVTRPASSNSIILNELPGVYWRTRKNYRTILQKTKTRKKKTKSGMLYSEKEKKVASTRN